MSWITHGHSLKKLPAVGDDAERQPKRVDVRAIHEMTDSEQDAWAEGIENPDARRMVLDMIRRERAERARRATD